MTDTNDVTSQDSQSEARDVAPYEVLAQLYDAVMHDVDYELWADFIDEIIQTHHPDPVDLLELACGTGSISFSLEELECYNLTATDASEAMIERARVKAAEYGSQVDLRVMNYLDINLDQTFDAAFSVFDSVNYLMSADQITQMLEQVRHVLRPGGLLIFDFTTPRNSHQAIQLLNNEEGSGPNRLRFHRTSDYDVKSRIHYNEFDIKRMDPTLSYVTERYHEIHRQRIYTLDEMLDIVSGTDYELIAKYGGFELVDADETSLRITMVLRCPKTQS